MVQDNPYQTPGSELLSRGVQDVLEAKRFEKMALGQKLVIYAVIVYVLSIVSQVIIGSLALTAMSISLMLFTVSISLILSAVGVFMVLSARKSHILLKIVLFLLLFIPLINLLTLLSINSRATKALKEAGYKVGFMGAKKVALKS